MSFYKVAHSIRLRDVEGSSLDIILESNGVSWKLLARHRIPGGYSKESDWDNYPEQGPAVEAFKVKVQQAQDLGWYHDNEDRRIE